MRLRNCGMICFRQLMCMTLVVASGITAGAVSHLEAVPRAMDGVDEAWMRHWVDTSPVQGIEGIWYYPAESMTVGVLPCPHATAVSPCHIMVMLAGDDVELLPGVVIGHIEPGAVNDRVSLTLYSERDRLTLTTPLQTVAHVNENNTELTFDPPHWEVKVRVNVLRFLPSLFGGMSVVPQPVGERMPLGLKKIYPATEAATRPIVYL